MGVGSNKECFLPINSNREASNHRANIVLGQPQKSPYPPFPQTVNLLPSPKKKRGLSLAALELFTLFVSQSTPHLSKLLSNLAKGDIGVLLLDLGAVLLAEQHESTEGLLRFRASALLGLFTKIGEKRGG